MSNIIQAIADRHSQLHAKEQALAQYIMDHALQVITMGIADLSLASSASTATISRFCKTFHFKGYTDFKVKLATELAGQPQSQSYQDIVAGNSLHKIIGAMEANHLRSITDTTRMLDVKELQRALDAFSEANRIELYGVATSGVVAQDFAQKLVRIGIHASASSDPHMQITSASNLQPQDVAFAISYSGETLETIASLQAARERGATTISLTKYGTNTLSKQADIKLFTSTLEAGIRRGDMASRIAQLHVIDILFTALLSSNFSQYIPQLELSYQMVQKYRKKR
ncbi:MurR/RpiR family transcriptional regulator [Paenibacillus psychroresistens]|uniref:MurR/RpiR family transcriptional regulator n=1 Tax=Paenibacillus psychroresistens TaxID=1778678 RepID=A0A6B8RSZ2_9BACL|nr:MurR/RpiR family transcriptional regulator [Paenibacillus psychroresistens]QGQ98563.1 MurR/RpiR family transcriptional regulator [Paenibacillus psychroresistens]